MLRSTHSSAFFKLSSPAHFFVTTLRVFFCPSSRKCQIQLVSAFSRLSRGLEGDFQRQVFTRDNIYKSILFLVFTFLSIYLLLSPTPPCFHDFILFICLYSLSLFTSLFIYNFLHYQGTYTGVDPGVFLVLGN